MLFWPIRASIPTIYRENKTVCVFFYRAFDGNARIRRNISQKFKKITKNLIFENRIFENLKYRQDRCPDVFFGCSKPRNRPKIPPKPDFLGFLIFFYVFF